MDAVVLCAGKGRRMLDSLDGSQKCMIQVNGKPVSGKNLGFLIYSQDWKHFATKEDLE